MEFEIEVHDQNSSLETVNSFSFFTDMFADTASCCQTIVLTELVILFQKATGVRLVGNQIDGLNTLGLIVWSFIFGLALRKMGNRGKLFVDILTSLNEATIHVVRLIIG